MAQSIFYKKHMQVTIKTVHLKAFLTILDKVGNHKNKETKEMEANKFNKLTKWPPARRGTSPIELSLYHWQLEMLTVWQNKFTVQYLLMPFFHMKNFCKAYTKQIDLYAFNIYPSEKYKKTKPQHNQHKKP